MLLSCASKVRLHFKIFKNKYYSNTENATTFMYLLSSSHNNIKHSIAFLGIVFTVSWSALFLAWSDGVRDIHNTNHWAFSIYVASPAITAIVFTILFKRSQWKKELGFNITPNIWWLYAFTVPVILAISSGMINMLLDGQNPLNATELAGRLASSRNEEAIEPWSYLQSTVCAISMLVVGQTILFTLTEELGWRGYLYSHWRVYGFLYYSLAIGLIWGIWHWPMIWLFGLNYPENRLLELIIFPCFTVLISIFVTLMRDRGQSVWAAGIFHGTWNAVGGPGGYAVFFIMLVGAIAIIKSETHQLSLLKQRNSNR